MKEMKKPRYETEVKYNFQPCNPKYYGTLKGNAYPFWSWRITNVLTNQKFDFFPRWEDLFILLKKCLDMEKKLDIVMGRPRESQKYFIAMSKLYEEMLKNYIPKTKEELKKELNELYDENVEVIK